MRIVWVDVYAVINFCADYLVCLLAARLCSAPPLRWRCALSALCGTVFALLSFFVPALLTLPGKLLGGMLMCVIAYGGRRAFSRLCAAHFALSAALGGTVWALGLDSGGTLHPGMTLLALSFALFYLLFSLLLHGAAGEHGREKLSVELSFLGRSARFFALRDTGNTLSDPISGARVMVVSPEALQSVFAELSPLLTLSEPTELLSAAAGVPKLRGRLRLIPYSAVGAKGFLAAFRPDALRVENKETREVLIALSPSASGDGYDAIF